VSCSIVSGQDRGGSEVCSQHSLRDWLWQELRSDHAGESGAVAIYHGILFATRDPDVRRFATRHLETERRHLMAIKRIVPPAKRSVFIALWRLAGFLTGLIPALLGPRAVYATVDAVERFVVDHYGDQIHRLDVCQAFPHVRARLESFQTDERSHQVEAQTLGRSDLTGLERSWIRSVQMGSRGAVAIARRI
jgi:ubiquinone biosynthesis monooxygenase Coq7